MKNSKSKQVIRIISFLLIVVAVFAAAAALTAGISRRSADNKAKAEQAKADKIAEEKAKSDTRVDKYSMQKYCAENSKAVFDALKAGDKAALEKLLIDSEGLDDVMDFADWSKADFDEAVSMGSGSLSGEPSSDGLFDESERFFVYAGSKRYVFFIETRTSDYGRTNDGVSAIGVTTFSHFDATDYAWNGEKDGQSALAGKLFWKD